MATALRAVNDALHVSASAPLSARHALQATAAFDHLADMAFVQRSGLQESTLATAQDILSFRTALRTCALSMRPLMDLMTCNAKGPRLQVVATQVEPEAFAHLPVADLMVSLYNHGTVPRLMLIQPRGPMIPMQGLLQSAGVWWQTTIDLFSRSRSHTTSRPPDTGTDQVLRN